MRSELEQSRSVIKRLNHEVNTAHESETSFKEEKATLTEKLAHVSHERTELDKKLSLLQSSFEDAQNSLCKAIDKIEYISQENMNLIQEKAIVEGQFKQLQNMLSTVEPI